VNYVSGRNKILGWLRAQLIGPAYEEVLLKGSPLDRYPTGILFPIVRGEEGIDPASTDEDVEDESDLQVDGGNSNAKAESTTKHRRYMPPSSVGFSSVGKMFGTRLIVLQHATRGQENGMNVDDSPGRNTHEPASAVITALSHSMRQI